MKNIEADSHESFEGGKREDPRKWSDRLPGNALSTAKNIQTSDRFVSENATTLRGVPGGNILSTPLGTCEASG